MDDERTPEEAGRPARRLSSLRALLANEASFAMLLAVLAGSIAFLKALRMPNSWAATQLQLDYSHGLIRRGLAGELLGRVLGLPVERFWVAAGISVVLLALSLASLAWLARRCRLHDRADGTLLVALMFGSYALTYLVHCIGYLDHVLILLAVAAVSFRGRRTRFVALGLLGVAGVLTHELFAIAFFPIAALPIFLDALAEKDDARSRRMLAALGSVALLVAVATLGVALAPALPAGETAQYWSTLQDRADFPLHEDFSRVLSESRSSRRPFWLASRGYLTSLVFSIPRFFPAAIFLLGVALGIARPLFDGWRRRMAAGAIVLAVLAPLTLHGLGIDVHRWHALLTVDAFLSVCLLHRHAAERGSAWGGLDAAARNLLFLLIALGMATGGGLMDDYATDVFPFEGSLRPLVDRLFSRW